MNQDISIAQAAKLRPIEDIARAAGIPEDHLEPYGRYKAKVRPGFFPADKPDGKLVLVTAISPTPAGEGKTTISIGLADGMRRVGVKAVLALREPSLGPVFGVKGGAAGGGYAQVAPMEDINLHFTGDLHAISAANNLLATMTDNHIAQGNALDIETVTFRRCMDMNDRQLRQTVSGLGGKGNGKPREDGFDITAACQVMAAFCLADGITDLKERLARIIVGISRGGKNVTAGDLKAQGAMAALLRDAMWPNLVQTLEGTPALVHGGPFANIAHGCNSVSATRAALKLGDVCVTEAGFGADLGAEKFLDIKCRQTGIWPDCAVVVATVRALKHHGGCPKEGLSAENIAALEAGLPNLMRHLENLKGIYNLPVVVALNRFVADTDAELDAVRAACAGMGVACVAADVWAKGGEGGEELARAVLSAAEKREPSYCYPSDMPLDKKIREIARRVYRADKVTLAAGVLSQLRKMPQDIPVCIAKTQYSFTDDPKKLAAPEGFTLTIRSVRLSAGAGFAVAFAGDIIAMPGLPPQPAAEGVDVDEDGTILGIF